MTPNFLLHSSFARLWKLSFLRIQNRTVEKGARWYRVPRPGFLQVARAVVKNNADWFWLSRVLYWFMYLDLLRKYSIDIGIEISKWLSLISKKKGHRLLIAVFTGVSPCGASNFSRHSFLGIFSDFTRSLSKGTRN